MAPVDSQGIQQRPAVHPKLAIYVDTATACLKAWARANGQTWDALTNPDALLLQTLLAKSRPESKRTAVPILPLGEFKKLLNEALTARRWAQFLRWFSLEISSDLEKTCEERAEPMLYPARLSNGNGGRGPKGQAIYFLSFEPPPQLGKPHPHDTGAKESIQQQNQAEAPATKAKEQRASPDPRDPPTQAEADAPGVVANCPGQESRPARRRQPHEQDMPLGVFYGRQSANPSGMSGGWILALALILFVATSAEPVSTPLVDEIVRILTAARQAVSGTVIVRF